jgi:hypothetical protein
VGLVDEIEDIGERIKMEALLLRFASITEIPLAKAEYLVRNMLLRDGTEEAYTRTRWGWVTLNLTIQDVPMKLWEMKHRPKPFGLNQPWPDPPTPKSVFQKILPYVEMAVDMNPVPLREGYYRWTLFIPREDAPQKILVWEDYCKKVVAEMIAKYWYRHYRLAPPPDSENEWVPESWSTPEPMMKVTDARPARAQPEILPPEPERKGSDRIWRERKEALDRAREAWNEVKRQGWPVRLVVDNSKKEGG